MPLLSVVMPTFNSGDYVMDAIRSVLTQTFTDFELLIMDDGSSDGTWERIATFDDPRIRTHRNICNVGLPTNMNIAMALACGKYLARVDHDDIAMPDRFERQIDVLETNPSITIVSSQVEHFHNEAGVSCVPLDDASIKARMVSGGDYFANQSSVGRLDFYRRHSLRFDPNLYIVDDLGFWLDCMFHGACFANLPQALTRYRIHAGMTVSSLNFERFYASKDRINRRVLPLFFPRLQGHECETLLSIYRLPAHMPQTLTHIVNLHRAARTALSDIDVRWGQSPEGCREAILGLLNSAREGFASRGLLRLDHAEVLDQLFRVG